MNKTPLLAIGLMAAVASHAHAVTEINLDFNGSGNNLAATGFQDVLNPETSAFNVADGALTIQTLEGDIFGRFEFDPEPDPRNVFSSPIETLDRTVVEARVSVVGLNANFHGGGVWLGVDPDHYVRLGVIHNDFEDDGPVRVEFLRENEDLWDQAVPPGPGTHILGEQVGIGGSSPLLEPIDLVLRVERDGNSVRGFFSLDDGATFTEVGSGFENFSLPGDPQGAGSNTLESDSLHAGVFAFGGGPFDPPAEVSFDSFTATALTAVEPLVGDLNNDGFVGAGDLDILLGVWNQSVSESVADLNDDGFIGAGDLDILLGNWNAGAPPSAVSAVPEPASAALLSVGALLLGRRRRSI